MSPGMVNVIRSLPACRNLSVEWTRTIYRMNWTYWAEVVWSHWPPFVWVLLWAIDSLGKFLSRCYPFVEELLGGKKKAVRDTLTAKTWTFVNGNLNEYQCMSRWWQRKPSNPWRFACQVAMASSSGGSMPSSFGVCFAMLSNLAFCCNSDA